MVVEFPSLKILISHLDMVMGNWVQVVLLEQQVVGPGDVERFFPISTSL